MSTKMQSHKLLLLALIQFAKFDYSVSVSIPKNVTEAVKLYKYNQHGVQLNSANALGKDNLWAYTISPNLNVLGLETRIAVLDELFKPAADNQFVYIVDATGPFSTTGRTLTTKCIVESTKGEKLEFSTGSTDNDVIIISITGTQAETIFCEFNWGTSGEHLPVYIKGLPDAWIEFEIYGTIFPRSLSSESV